MRPTTYKETALHFRAERRLLGYLPGLRWRLQLDKMNGAADSVRALYAGSPLAAMRLRLWPMPTIDLTDTELAAITALVRRAIEQDGFPAPRLDSLRSAIAKLDPAAAAALRRPQAAKPPTGLLRPLARFSDVGGLMDDDRRWQWLLPCKGCERVPHDQRKELAAARAELIAEK
jgi:hypothetical protein